MDLVKLVIIATIYESGWGLVTALISKSKGYDGGFWWGFGLGVIGVIVVSGKPINYDSIENDDLTYDNWTCPNCHQFNDGFTSVCMKCEHPNPEQSQATLEIESESTAIPETTPELQTKDFISAADAVLKLKQLLDAGAITQEEFDVKKKQFLGL